VPGRSFKGFDVIEIVGEGGMGSVYKAHQRSLDRLVAIKALAPSLAPNAGDVERFKLEAKAAAQFKHPGIVQVYEAGEDHGTYFFAMEYVDGYSVGDWLNRDGRLSDDDALIVADSVARALGHAWDTAKVVHRDIKPGNILIDEDGTVKVGDLGLVKMIGGKGLATLVADGVCSPNYCSPEQAQGLQDLDCRSDMYSLGAMLYHMVTGHAPFHDVAGTGPIVKHVTDQLDDPRSVNPEVSRNMVLLLRRLMAKDREKRQQTWDEVVEDVRSVQAGKPPHVPLARGVETTVRWAPPREVVPSGQAKQDSAHVAGKLDGQLHLRQYAAKLRSTQVPMMREDRMDEAMRVNAALEEFLAEHAPAVPPETGGAAEPESLPAPQPSPGEVDDDARSPSGEPFLVPRRDWKVARVSSESKFNGKIATRVFDGDPASWWHSQWQNRGGTGHPHELVIDLGEEYTVCGVRVAPRNDQNRNGRIKDYALYVANDPDALGRPVYNGAFQHPFGEQEQLFLPTTGRYVAIRSLSSHGIAGAACIAELNVLAIGVTGD